MKILISIFLFTFLIGENTWLTNINKAKQEAATNNKLILLNFSGSDWCGPCMRTKKEIFDTDVFIKYASKNLVLLNADFPRLKKNKLDDALTKSNEALADMYNKEGEFPLTLLLDAKGKVLKSWIGFPKESPSEFVDQIKTISNGNK
jgi:thioredoxin-related protein